MPQFRVDGRLSQRSSLLTSTAVSVVTLFSAVQVNAASAPSGQSEFEEIVVTGSRIVRDGYEAPTPVTVVGIEQIQDTAKPNIADVLNQMPVFQNSRTPNNSGAINSGGSGSNNLNLRNLGSNRALILFNGHRVPPQFVDGTVDINLFPDALISRVDVVTGGASAVYGSDAVAGVVNFILDTEFTGVKGLVQGGISQQGDAENFKVSLSSGTEFANGRGHFLISGDYSRQEPLRGDAREWNTRGYYGILNPLYTATNGQPQYIYREQVGHSNGYKGGIISGGPLKGIAFGPGGTPFQYNYGNLVNASFHQGGDWRESTQAGGTNIMVGNHNAHLFSRVSYDLTDNIEFFAEFNNAESRTQSRCCWVYYLGNLTMQTDNAFLPAEVANRARSLNLANFPYGIILHSDEDFAGDDRGFGTKFGRVNDIYTAGLNGNFDTGETNWTWDAYVQRGISKLSFYVPFQSKNDRFADAIDAVRSPSGAIVCRSTLTNPNNGCVPYNIFGTGVVTEAAFNWVMDGPSSSQTIAQNVAGASITGSPFESWAGPISIALNAEYRKDSVQGIHDPLSPERGWYSTQLTTFPASQNVKEVAVETLIPLANGKQYVEALDLSLAARGTDYSASGFVTTWKAGVTYTPITDVRFRFTQSRDIRAPNLTELFSTPQTNHSTIPDPFRNNVASPYYNVSQGNPDLIPEKADTTGLGIVYQPEWLPGFNLSVDYYRINIKGAIVVVAFADVLNKCFAGETAYCSDVIREPPATPGAIGVLDSVISRPQNQQSRLAKGIDIESSYSTPLSNWVDSWDGILSARVVASNILNLVTDSGIDGPTRIQESAGVGSTPRWGVTGNLGYSLDRWRVTYTGRWYSAVILNNLRIECQAPNCPAFRAGFTTVDDNSQPSYFISNMSFSYRFHEDGKRNAEAFFAIDNLFDKEPYPSAAFGGTTYQNVNGPMTDSIGRQFRAGVRFQM